MFTGVSGSGKSSLVFSTIAAESQRLINETYPAFVQQFMPHYGQPDADVLENISAAIIVDQQRLGGNVRSTVATATDTAQMLRVLFSRLAEPRLPAPGYYSYNDPRGMCAECEGVGQVAAIDMAAVVDETKSLNQGALLHKVFAVHGWWWDIYARSGMFDLDKPIRKYSKEERANLFDLDDGRKVKVDKINLTYLGVVPKLRQMMGDKDPEALQPHVRAEYDKIFTRKICPACKGARLKAEALASKISKKNIAELSRCRSVTWPRWCARSRRRKQGRCWRPWRRASKTWSPSGSAISALTARARACRAVRASGSRWCAISAPRSPTSLMYSTSPRWGCIRTMWGAWPA